MRWRSFATPPAGAIDSSVWARHGHPRPFVLGLLVRLGKFVIADRILGAFAVIGANRSAARSSCWKGRRQR
jgi:hypothetical protein